MDPPSEVINSLSDNIRTNEELRNTNHNNKQEEGAKKDVDGLY